MNIEEALTIWNKRCSINCPHRVASRCKHEFSLGQCRIQFCPILGPKAKLEMKIIYEFTDMR